MKQRVLTPLFSPTTVASMIVKMKAERKKVALIARELNLSRQTIYEVLRCR
jgi:predicted transcriptional regulator